MAQLESRRVLIVEDEKDTLESMAILLTSYGHAVECCFGASGCLMAVKNFQPQVVLLDIGLPEMSGYELARLIRRMDHFKDVLLIAITGFGTERDRALSVEVGINHHLTKPADIEEILKLISTAR